jgi:hypothetical protein
MTRHDVIQVTGDSDSLSLGVSLVTRAPQPPLPTPSSVLPERPSCMTPLELASWSQANARVMPVWRALSPCEDCTQEFAREQRGPGLCTGTPPVPEIPNRTITCHNSDYRKCPPRALGSPERDDDLRNVEMALLPIFQVARSPSPAILARRSAP